jgi:hypothetical protein
VILQKNYPKFNGVDDLEDSPVAACLGFITGLIDVDPELYITPSGKYQRWIFAKYDISRDQVVMLMALLKLKGRSDLVSLDRATGKDLYAPSIRGHERICKGLAPRWYQTAWFKLDLWWSATFQPVEELNQLFAMLLVHPDKSLLKWYCKKNPLWMWAIRKYFAPIEGNSWRREPELAELMIKKITACLQA